MKNKVYDTFIVGGGINGCGIARDAVGRGYSVCLVEKNDIASGTSSSSSKLIHGGLRYLENFQFSLVRSSLKERDILIKMAPHIIKESRFLLPYHHGLRPVWMLRLGIFLYDNLYSSKYIKHSSYVDFASHPSQKTILDSYTKGFEYSDCIADDSRLTILNAVDVVNKGGVVKTQTKVINIEWKNNLWEIKTIDLLNNIENIFKAKIVINATGPWADKFLTDALKQKDVKNIRLVKGSHIVIKRLFKHNYSYIFQNDDGRIFFVIPWEEKFTFIGTTDVDFDEDIDNIAISNKEIEYLCKSANDYFKTPITKDDVISHWSGVRPLYDTGKKSAQKASRDYVIKMDKDYTNLINIFGGKLTTFRKLSEDTMNIVETIIGKKNPAWTKNSYLFGGDFAINEKDIVIKKLQKKYSYLDLTYLQRLFNLYGTTIESILKDVTNIDDLGINFGEDLYQVEVDYLMRKEFARFAEDITQRRTKLYLLLTKDNLKYLETYMEKQRKI